MSASHLAQGLIYAHAQTVEGGEQTMARGPVATQVVIRTLGTNGGGFFSVMLALLVVGAVAGHLVPLIAALAIASSLASKRSSVFSPGTLRTDTATFAAMLAGVVVITSFLTILPGLALGPIAEALSPAP